MSDSVRWIFPSPGQSVQPLVADANFGPVHFQDSIVLEFSPASYTGQIQLYCDWLNHTQGSGLPLADNLQTGSPLPYNFNALTPNSKDPNDYHACYFYFTNAASPNAQVFQLLNTPSNTPTTWRAPAAGSGGGSGGTSSGTSSSTSSTAPNTSTSTSGTISTTATSSTSTSASTSSSNSASNSPSSSSSSSNTAGSNPSFTATNSADSATSPTGSATSSSSSTSLSGGAIAGIVIGVLVLIALLVGAGFLLGRRRARKDKNGPGHTATAEVSPPLDNWGSGGGGNIPTGTGVRAAEAYGETAQRHELGYDPSKEKYDMSRYRGADGAGWNTQKSFGQPHLAGGQQRSELDAARRYELHNEHRNEMHA